MQEVRLGRVLRRVASWVLLKAVSGGGEFERDLNGTRP